MASIPYNPNVPQSPGDTFATSQPQLEANFSQLYNYFMRNHVALDATTSAGNHTVIQLLEQSNAKQTSLNDIAI